MKNEEVEMYIGIDPGINGALALLRRCGDGVLQFETGVVMPTVKRTKRNGWVRDVDPVELIRLLFCWANQVDIPVFIERISARPGQGVVSMFSMGNALGVVQGCLAAASLTPILVNPVAWKRYHGLLHSDKEASRQKAIKLFGAEHFPLKKHHGLAEACLIAAFGASQMEGKP